MSPRTLLWMAVDACWRAARGEPVQAPTRFQFLALSQFGRAQ